MSDDADKLVVKEFEAGGRKYRAEELSSNNAVRITDLKTGENVVERWPQGFRQGIGSEAAVDVTIEGVKSQQDGFERLKKLHKEIAEKAAEEERKKAGGQTDAENP